MHIPLKSRTAYIYFVGGGGGSSSDGGGGCCGDDDDLGVGGSGGGAITIVRRVTHKFTRIWSIRQGSLNASFRFRMKYQ